MTCAQLQPTAPTVYHLPSTLPYNAEKSTQRSLLLVLSAVLSADICSVSVQEVGFVVMNYSMKQTKIEVEFDVVENVTNSLM